MKVGEAQWSQISSLFALPQVKYLFSLLISTFVRQLLYRRKFTAQKRRKHPSVLIIWRYISSSVSIAAKLSPTLKGVIGCHPKTQLSTAPKPASDNDAIYLFKRYSSEAKTDQIIKRYLRRHGGGEEKSRCYVESIVLALLPGPKQ